MNMKLISSHCVILFLTVSCVAQNVGLGTNTPNGRLQFKNEIFNRLLVLNESGNNEHNFFGFGINEFTLRYQVADPAQSHVFFAGNAANATGSNELLRIQGNGNIGIGYNNPQRPLSFPPFLGKKISLYPGIVGDAGFSVWGNELRIHSDNPIAAITFGVDAYNAPQFTERMRITGSGNVGIGNSNPTAPLQFAADTRNRKVVLWSVTDNDHQFYGFGVNGFTLRYQTAANTDDHVFFSGAGNNASTELFRIKGTGALGVGPTGSTGQPQLVLTSKGPNNPPQWEPARQVFVVYQNAFTSFSSSKVDLPGAVAEFTLTRAARVKFNFGVSASFFNCFACGNKRVNFYLEQNVSGGTVQVSRSVFHIPENLDISFTATPVIIDLPPGSYSYKLSIGGGGQGSAINASAISGSLIWEIFYQ
jgi:hypothetical protein